MPNNEFIHRTVFQIEVFSRGSFSPQKWFGDPFELGAINYAITVGGCAGNVERVSEEVVPAGHLKDELVRIGEDEEFFS
jgi:predicted oxidoreductase